MAKHASRPSPLQIGLPAGDNETDTACLRDALAELGHMFQVDSRRPGSTEQTIIALRLEAAAAAAARKATTAACSRTAPSSTVWAPGTGYASDGESRQRDAGLAERQRATAERQTDLIAQITSLIRRDVGSFALLEGSCLVRALEHVLRNDSLLDAARAPALLNATLALLELFAERAALVPLLARLEGQPVSLARLLSRLNAAAAFVLRVEGAGTGAGPVAATSKADATAETEAADGSCVLDPAIQLAKRVQSVFAAVTGALAAAALPALTPTPKGEAAARATFPATAAAGGSTAAAAAASAATDVCASAADLDALYCAMMAASQFGESSLVSTLPVEPPSKATLTRLAQEAASVSTSLPLSASSSVFVRVDDERMNVWQALIFGPRDTPYADGAFCFDIVCDSAFPTCPPHVSLRTTGRGSVSFNPNLYACGRVCLSLLGTWAGSTPDEEWSVDSTILQVLVSIQSLILVPEPYFNEPGYESESISSGSQYKIDVARDSMHWAVLDALRCPEPAFADVIRAHFFVKAREIIARARADRISTADIAEFEALVSGIEVPELVRAVIDADEAKRLCAPIETP